MKTVKSLPLNKSRKRILLIDDHPITRYGLTQLINHQPDLVVCGEAGSALQALGVVQSLQPDLVLVDLTLPGKSGLEFIKDMQALHPALAVLAVSMHDESVYAERVLRAGARGYIMKNEGGERLLEAIRQVLLGQVYISKSMSATMLDVLTRRRPSPTDSRPGSLTDREFEIFQLIGQGLSTREIGLQLSLSVKTVETHRQHIKDKLNVRSGPKLIQEAVRWAATQQLV